MRLENLFRQAAFFLRGTSVWNSQATLDSILEIQNLLGRNDLKTEVLKELERHTGNLARLERNPDVDRERLGEILDELDQLIDRLYADSQPLGHELKQNEFLGSIRQRASIPGGTCQFDLPGYYHWLQRPDEQRVEDLRRWIATFDVLQQAIEVVLQLLRGSVPPQRELAAEGFYQRSLDPNSPPQLLRIALPVDSPYYPEISGGKHRFTIRFLQQDSPEERAIQIREDVEFALACCLI